MIDRPLSFHAIDVFGEAVGLCLEPLLPLCSTEQTPFVDGVRKGSTVLVAGMMPDMRSAQAYMTALVRCGGNFLPVLAKGSRLLLGPLYGPDKDAGGCWVCAIRRMQQGHRAGEDPAEAKRATAAVKALSGAAAAALAWACDVAPLRPGEVLLLDLARATIACESVVGFHGCPYCGLGREASKRTTAALHAELNYLWQDGKE